MAPVGLSDHFRLPPQQHHSLVLGVGQFAPVVINLSRPWKRVLFPDHKVQNGMRTVWFVEENDHLPHPHLGCSVGVKKRRKGQDVAKSLTARRRLTMTVEFGADSVW